jgi:hypothetical protein
MSQTCLHNYMAFHSDSTRKPTSDNVARLVDGPWVQVAALLCSDSHDFTNGNGSHTVIGGPDNEININEDICLTVRRDRKLVQCFTKAVLTCSCANRNGVY